MAKKQQEQLVGAVSTEEMTREIERLQKEIVELRRELGLDPAVEVLGSTSPLQAKGKSSAPQKKVLSKLLNEAEQEQNHKAEEPTAESLDAMLRSAKHKKGQPNEYANGLPARDDVGELSVMEQVCRDCGDALCFADRKMASQELQILPGQYSLVNHYVCKYVCPGCRDKGILHTYEYPAPTPLLKKSMANPATLAFVLTEKFSEGKSLARLEKDFAKDGIVLSRATLANWVVQCADTCLKPVYKHMKKELMTQPVILSDRLGVHVMKADGSYTFTPAWITAYTSRFYSNRTICLYEYQTENTGKRPEAFLKDFTGHLLTNGDPVYDKVKGVIPCACWTSMEWKWLDAMPIGPERKTSKAAAGADYCKRIVSMAKKSNRLEANLRKEYRQNFIAPVVEEYFLWVNTVHPGEERRLAEAVAYAKQNKDRLCVFLDNEEVPQSTDFAMSMLRSFEDGNKSWVFSETKKGSQCSLIALSLVETAKANGVNPYLYFLYVLTSLQYVEKQLSHEFLSMLMPWSPRAQKDCK